MDVYLHRSNFEGDGLIDGYISFVWTERYDRPGDFQLKIPLGHTGGGLLMVNRYLRIAESNKLMFIKNYERVTNEEEGDHIVVTGKSAEIMLDDRVVTPNTPEGEYVKQGNLAHTLTEIVNRECVWGQGLSSSDVIPRFVTADSNVYGYSETVRFEPENLLTVLERETQNKDMGFRINYNPSNRYFEFRVYRGVDRSGTLAFGPEFENVSNLRYLRSVENYKNVAYVHHRSRSIGTPTIVSRGGLNYSGLDRHVISVDASNIQDPTAWDLERAGRDALNEHTNVWVLDGEVVADNLVYNRDYFLGDILTVEDGVGRKDRCRVIEHTWSFDGDGLRSYPTFRSVES